MGLDFEWDKRKAETNREKHGIAFEEASSVFDDPLAIIFDDEEHSDEELREIIVGHSSDGRLIIVSFTERGESLVRIISARKVTRHERQDYEEGNIP